MSLARAAALNNAAWVDAVARSHGVATRRDGAAWRADGAMPPYNPNLVTLDPEVDAATLLADPPRGAAAGWGLKDSFAAMDLTAAGFVAVFDAVWLAAEAPCRAGGAGRVTTQAALARWVRGWGETPDGATVFVPGLLDVPGVRFYAVEDGGMATAGLAALVEGEVAGYSNAFGDRAGIAACLGALAADAGALPVVGYEGEEAVAPMTRLGFRPVGGLRVWSCQRASR